MSRGDFMKCIKCRKEIPAGSIFCNYCGKKQVQTKQKTHKRAHGTGTIRKDTRYRKSWVAIAPANRYGKGREYIGCYATMREAQEALEKYILEGRPELYNATLEEVYRLWSGIHYQRVSQSAVSLYTAMWKRFSAIQGIKMRDVRTAHFQEIVNRATSKSACDTLKAMACMICDYAMENDIINKNYADFIKIPRFEKKEKKIFSAEDISKLWEHADDKRVQVILFMIYTGLRIGEVTTLKVSDMHLEEGYMICGEKTEAGKNRLVPIPRNIPELYNFITDWMQETRTESLLNLSVPQLRNYYFYDSLLEIGLIKGNKPSGNSYQFEGEHYTPHSTRHTFASLSASAGMQPEKLQKIIGHANYITTAEIYIHQNVEELISEMGKIKK